MKLSVLLEIAISLAFLYLISSQVVLSIYEIWAGYRNTRGKFLYQELQGSLGIETANALYVKAPIATLSPPEQKDPATIAEKEPVKWWIGKDGLPAYIAPDLFAKTLLELVAPNAGSAPVPIAAVASILSAPVLPSLPTYTDPQTGKSIIGQPVNQATIDLLSNLLHTIDQTHTGAFDTFQHSIAAWYEAYGERLTGWYKRRVRPRLFMIGFVVAILGNIDTLYIIKYLRTHDNERSQITSLVTQKLPQSAERNPVIKPTVPIGTDTVTVYAQESLKIIKEGVTDLSSYGFPIGREKPDTITERKVALPVVDSSSLQNFYEFIPRHAESRLRDRDGKLKIGLAGKAPKTAEDTWVLVNVPAHYRHYELQQDTVTESGLPVVTKKWKISRIPKSGNSLPTALAKSKDRSPKVLAKLDSIRLGQMQDKAKQEAMKRREALKRPWLNPQASTQSTLQTCLGWLLTAALLALGAPFWFDLLCRLVNIRNLGIKPPRMPKTP
ncbi:hypothetical protein [Hymenobacter tenuis]